MNGQRNQRRAVCGLTFTISLSSLSSSTSTTFIMSPSSSSSSSSSGGKCPVDHQSGSVSLWSLWGVGTRPSTTDKIDASQDAPTTTTASGAAAASVAASLEEAAKHAQSPHPTQRLPLSTHRAESSIPRGDVIAIDNNNSRDTTTSIPHHQLGTDSNNNHWVYPSEQQVFNAMKRKGWDGIEEESIPSFLQIHNSVNEQSWRLVQEWETASSTPLQLVRFEGRPKELSPKAWIWSKLLFQDPPFDRHDWYVDNGVEKEKRYVLDFYMTDDQHRGGLPRVDIDVRPALDTPSAVYLRAQRGLMDLFPGITKELQRLQSSSSSSSHTPTSGR